MALSRLGFRRGKSHSLEARRKKHGDSVKLSCSYRCECIPLTFALAVLVRILEIIHDALAADTIVTKRDIYYRHPDLFVKQAVVDRYVDDLACTFGVSRTLLNVVCLLHLFEYLATVLIGLKSAAAKGLIAGNFTIQRRDGSQINGLKDREGLLIPNLHNSDTIDMSNVRWILVVEKEVS